MKKYDKPPLTFEKQVDLLQSRGLAIKDRDKACEFLSQINYYRFSAYCLQFEEKRDKFKPGASFEQIQQLYEFDRSFRFLIDEALEVIEIAVRTTTAYHLSRKYGPFMHEDVANFYPKFNHKDWIENVHKEAERSSETFVLHYKDTYDGFPALPLWMVVEIMSFGSLSRLVSGLHREDQIEISRKFELHHMVLCSWLHTFMYIRNICAHHSRMWDRDIAIAIVVPRNKNWQNVNSKRIASVLFAINYFLSKAALEIHNKEDWHSEMTKLLNQDMRIPNFLGIMGLPENFKAHCLWKV